MTNCDFANCIKNVHFSFQHRPVWSVTTHCRCLLVLLFSLDSSLLDFGHNMHQGKCC